MPRPIPHASIALLLLLVLLAAGCSPAAELLHGLDEGQANEVLVALEEDGLSAAKRREEGGGGPGSEVRWLVEVGADDASHARRLLSERALPRVRAAGFEEVLAKGSMVPTPAEEHARFQHALAGELSRSIERLDGVLEARVHLGLPEPDPLRPDAARAPRAAVLVKCRPAACDALRGLEGGIRSLVAGAADGLAPEAVSVVVAPGAGGPPAAAPEPASAAAPMPAAPAIATPAADGGSGVPVRRRSPVLLGLAALAGTGALGAAGWGLRGRGGAA